MKKRNRIISLILCGVLILSLVPQTVFGAEVAGAGSSEDNGQNLVLQSEEECICETLCAEDSINTECPVCSVEGADFSKCQGAADQTEDVPDPAVTAVQEQMDALPTVEEVAGMDQEQQLTVKEQVQAVQEAYNALTQEQKEEVTGAEILEELLAALENGTGAAEVVASGTFGEDDCLSWSLDSNGLLIVTGVEDMPDCEWNHRLPSGVASFPWDGLKDKITEIVINGGVTSIPNAFRDCTNLVKVTLSDKITSLGGGAFTNCTNLKTINLPDSLRWIADGTFRNCRKLELTKLPSNLEGIGDSLGGCTFENCTSISSINLPASLTYMEVNSFSGCTGLKTINFAKGFKCPIAKEAFSGCTGLEAIEFPSDSNFSIDDGAFSGCTGIETIKFSEGSEYTIGEKAFSGCTGLKRIEFSNDSEYSFGTEAFSGCSGLEMVEFPTDLNFSISEGMFAGCTGLETIKFSRGSHITINERAFEGCEKLKNIEFPDDLMYSRYTIEENAFHNCTGLISLELPQNVNSIGKEAFSGCVNLEKLSFDGDAPYLEKNVFEGCDKLTIYIPAGAVGYTKENNWPEELIAHPITVQDDGHGTASASSIAAKSGEEVTLTVEPNSGYQFEKWEIVSGDVTIEDNKFIMPMSDVTIRAIFRKAPVPGEVAYGTFGENDSWSWSLDSQGLLTINGEGTMPDEGWDIETPWSAYADQIVKVEVVGKIYGLGAFAFKDCEMLESVKLPEGMTYIRDSAFENCINLKTAELPDSMIFIWNAAFKGCGNLTLSKLPSELTDIQNYAFSGCSNLTLTELPANLQSIGEYAFENCSGLALTRLPVQMDTIGLGKYAFKNCTNLALEKLPIMSDRINEGVFEGCKNLTLNELPDNIKTIGISAFKGCSNLALTEFPTSLAYIRQDAFSGCSSLTSLDLPKNLDSIEAGAFDGCTNLEELTFDGKVAPLIDANMFDDCEDLTIYIPAGAVGYTKGNNWPEELIAHPITVQDDGHGAASASRTGAKAGTEIILIAKPDDGYQFAQWEVVSGGVTIEDDTFTMPMGDVTVKARFEKAPDQGQEPEKGRYYTLHFDTNGGSSLGFVYEKEDTAVSLLHYIPVRAGYQFTGWYEDVELTKKITSVRLDENMIVYAGWEKIETDTREEQKISMMNALQVRDLKNGSRTTSSKVCTLKLGFAADDPDLELTYTTSDPSVATVKDGKITYQGVGECTITVTAEETETCKAASLSITVKVGALGTPTFTPSVTAKTAKKAFTVTSNTVRGVDGYEVQYSIRKDFWKPVTKDFSDTGEKLYRKTCPTMQSNRTYYIHVRGYQVIDGEKIYSDWSPVKTIKTK